jgi:hypothetical protein
MSIKTMAVVVAITCAALSGTTQAQPQSKAPDQKAPVGISFARIPTVPEPDAGRSNFTPTKLAVTHSVWGCREGLRP